MSDVVFGYSALHAQALLADWGSVQPIRAWLSSGYRCQSYGGEPQASDDSGSDLGSIGTHGLSRAIPRNKSSANAKTISIVSHAVSPIRISVSDVRDRCASELRFAGLRFWAGLCLQVAGTPAGEPVIAGVHGRCRSAPASQPAGHLPRGRCD